MGVKHNRVLDCLLWMLAMGFAVSIPFQGAVNETIPKAYAISLGLAGLFSITLCITALLRRQAIMYIKRQPLLCVLAAVTMIITTVKFGVDLSNGNATAFFAYYEIPAFMISAFAFSVWFQDEQSRMLEMMQLYALSFCLLYIVYSERFMMDIDGIVRSVGNYMNPNEMGVYAFFALGSAVLLIVKKRFSLVINLLIVAISTVALFLSESRTALCAAIAFAAVTGVRLLIHGLKKKQAGQNMLRKKHLLRPMLGLLAVVVLICGFYLGLRPNLLTVTDFRGSNYTYVGKQELIKAYPDLRKPLEEQLAKMDVQNSEIESGGLESDEEIEPGDLESDESVSPNGSTEAEYANTWKSVLRRIVDGDNVESSAIFTNLRFRIWFEYLGNAKDYWVFGAETGMASAKPVIEKIARATHNTLLYLFVQYGILVLLLCVWIAMRLLRRLVFTKRLDRNLVPLSGILAGLIFFLMFNDLVNVPVFWMILAVLCCIARGSNEREIKNVAIVRKYSGIGGVERQIASICQGLTERGITVHLITDAQTTFSENCGNIGAVVEIMPLSNPIVAGVKIAFFCRSHHIDILQTHMFFESFVGRVARFFSGSIYHVFRVHTYIDCSHIPIWKKNIYHAVAFWTDRQVDRYAAINMFNQKELIGRSHISEQKISVVHDGVRAVVSTGEKTDTSKVRLVMPANFAPFKGHDVLVKGVDILRKQGIRVSADFYGGYPGAGTDREDTTVFDEIQAMVRDRKLEDQIHFCGYATDIGAALNGAYALVLPSYSEGTPNCVLEAMSARVLTICSSVGGVPEFLVDGVSGYCHEPKSPEAFADAVMRSLQASPEQKDRILDRAYHVWQDEYALELLLPNLLQCYEKLNDA